MIAPASCANTIVGAKHNVSANIVDIIFFTSLL
jgi:hypothetical protein